MAGTKFEKKQNETSCLFSQNRTILLLFDYDVVVVVVNTLFLYV